MRVYFRTYDDKTETYEIKGSVEIEDYDVAFKMFTFMKEHECGLCLECNITDDLINEGETYRVKDVMFVFTKIDGETLPYIAVDIERDYY